MPTLPDDASFLRLAFTRGVGARAAHKLLLTIGDVGEVFAASELALSKIVGDKLAKALIAARTGDVEAKVQEALNWSCAPSHHLLTWAHPQYPRLLLESGDAPIVLHAIGSLETLSRPTIAIVGSRNCSQGGTDTAEAFSEALSQQGVAVVSGLAVGIDAAAHLGALRGAGGTIAVIGTGIDRIYPARNKTLAHSIAQSGLILSEYPLGTAPLPENFPRRNRIISGISLGVLVVEASMQSGSLITARLAAEQGREVFAIPGSIHSTFHKGCHHLIKQGAKLVETAADILDELKLAPTAQATAAARSDRSDKSTDTNALLAHLEHDPVDVDTLVQRSALAVDVVVTELTLLELAGQVESLAGGLWQRRN